MKDNLPVNDSITIPAHELEITTSRAGGPGGQHVNKTSTKITVRWNVAQSQVLTDEQKERILKKLASSLTSENDLVVQNSSSRSQLTNKKLALAQLARLIRKALYIPKKRVATKTPQAAQEKRLKEKKKRSDIKKMRKVAIPHE